MKEIYLDNAATTKPLPEVVDVINEYLTEKWYNPSSKYTPALYVKRCVERARNTIADCIGAEPSEIYFTSGASEANSMAIHGLICFAGEKSPWFVTSAIEHKSILADYDEYFPFFRKMLRPVRYTGEIPFDASTISQLKIPMGSLVSIQWANNEIGAIQDVKFFAEVCNNHNILFHTDATQAFPHIKMDMSKNKIHAMSVSGHKFGAPKGIGFLYMRNGLEDKFHPVIGGAQERGMRGGTENVPYIMGMAKAVELMNQGNNCPTARYFEDRLVTELGCHINGMHNKLQHIISATFPEYVVGEYLIQRLADYGIYLSAGSACNSYANTPSTVLDAIGLTHDEISRTVRISLSDSITREDVDETITVMKEICERFKM